MIFNKLYLSENYYILLYNDKKYVKISFNNNNIFLEHIDHVNTYIVKEMVEAFVLYQFPFTLEKLNNSNIKISFLEYLNSKIIFFIHSNKLICKIIIDDTIVKEYYVTNKCNDKIKLYLTRVKDIDPLTYIDDIEIYNYKDKGYPYVYLIIPNYKYDEIKNLANKNKWIISMQNI